MPVLWRAIILAVAGLPVLPPPSATAQDRLVRRFDGDAGLVPPVVALAQDSVGFIWASTRAGLYRYDGTRFHHWAPDLLPRAVGTIAVAASGRTVVVDAEGRILELARDGARQLPGVARRSPDHTRVATFDADGRLWVIGADGGLAWSDPSGGWNPRPDVLDGDTARRVFPAGVLGGILVAGADGLWRIGGGPAARKIMAGQLIVDAIVLDDGTVMGLTVSADLIRVPPGGTAEPVSWGRPMPVTRAIALASRGGTIWAGTDRYLISLGPDTAAELLGSPHGVVAGGPLLVDHEGSLWHGGFTTLSQYPEPATRVWNEQHGLRSNHTRFLARTDDALWITTWQGPAMLRLGDGRWGVGPPVEWSAGGQMCQAESGTAWVNTRSGLYRLRGTEAVPIADYGINADLTTCRRASDGGFWIGSALGLHHMTADGSAMTAVPSFPFAGPDSRVHVVLEDGAGRLWAASYERICHADAGRILAGAAVEWSCDALPAGVVHLNGLAEPRAGVVWAVSATLGVLHRTAAGWQVAADNEKLPTRSVLNIVPSQRGGAWLVGAGTLQRVEPDADGGRWTVLERLGAWHGLPSVGGGDLLEEDDGTVWIATAQGVVQVPASVRTAEPPPPRMAVVEARVDGRPVRLGQEIVLSADRNRLELRFAALTFRDPGRVRYQVRLSSDEAWTETEGQPLFTWVDLPAGAHQPQVRATLGGTTWSALPAALPFRVLPAWYRTGWALALFALLGAALLFALYRARLAYLLGLERQRTRIAMDLHDEMGSGLASIGILAGVMAGSRRDAADDRRIAQEVAVTAEELGTALSDIVWSLDPQSATLEELAARLAEHGGRLFADDVEFDTSFPSVWPSRPMPLPVLRNVLLIGLEALHNAARHAEAEHVRLTFEQGDDGWAMSVRDDGRGLPSRRAASARGRGMRAMRRRAGEIGGEIVWTAQPGCGTTVRLRFDPGATRRPRWTAWLRTPRRARASATVSHEHAGAERDRVAHH